MKKPLVLVAVLAALASASLAVQAQDAGNVADASSAFAQISPDMQGTVTQPITHAPAGDVLAAYFGRAPRQVYSKQDELLYVISGHGSVSIGYPSFDLKPGSVISIPRGTSFEITSTGRAPIKAIVIASPNNDPGNKRIL